MLNKDFIQDRFLPLLSEELYIQVNSVISATVYISSVREIRFDLDKPEGMNAAILYYGDMTFEFTLDYITELLDMDDFLDEGEEFCEGFSFVFGLRFDEGTMISIYKNDYIDEEDNEDEII